jgi:hypothetical protein
MRQGEPISFGSWLVWTTGRLSVFELALSETPSTKPQTPEKFQISSTKPQNQVPGQAARSSVFELGASLELGGWEFEACCLGAWLLKD